MSQADRQRQRDKNPTLYLEIEAINRKIPKSKTFLEFDFVYVRQFSEPLDETFNKSVSDRGTDKVSYIRTV